MDDNSCSFHSGILRELKSIWRTLDEKESKYNLQLMAMDKAVAAAKGDMDRRLEGMNEFRAQLEKQAGTFASRAEFTLRIDNLSRQITALEKIANQATGSSTWSDYLITVLIAAIVSFVMWQLR